MASRKNSLEKHHLSSDSSSYLNLRSHDPGMHTGVTPGQTIKVWCSVCNGKGYHETAKEDLFRSEPNLNLWSGVSDRNSNNVGSRSYGPACELRPAPDGISRYTPGAGTLSKQHLNHRHDMWNAQPKRQDQRPKHKDSTWERPLKRFLMRKKRQKKPHNSTVKLPPTDSYDTSQEPKPDYDSKLFLGLNIEKNAFPLFVWYYEYRIFTMIYYCTPLLHM